MRQDWEGRSAKAAGYTGRDCGLARFQLPFRIYRQTAETPESLLNNSVSALLEGHEGACVAVVPAAWCEGGGAEEECRDALTSRGLGESCACWRPVGLLAGNAANGLGGAR
jgi:hypothetical protein